MFQTFSGSSRRPRQVNLSGQNINPFAASSWTPAASGTQQTVANAQQERQQRQQERERLNASRRIQRIWRGHKARRELADSRRTVWDETEAARPGSEPDSALTGQLRLLVAFFSARRHDDLERLINLSQRIALVGYESFLLRQDIQSQIIPVANVTLNALQVYVTAPHMIFSFSTLRSSDNETNGTYSFLPECQNTLLQLLIAIIDRRPDVFPRISRPYYSFISTLLDKNRSGKLDKALVLTAIRVPLTEHIELDQNGKHSHIFLQILIV